jgi:aminoglycoside phosphotransferase (APT) family kinase protein
MHKNNQSYEQMIEAIIISYFGQLPKFIKHITIGSSNEVYDIGLQDKEVIVRLSPHDKYLMGSSDHIPKFKALGIKVPDILVEDFSKTKIPLAYQIQSKIKGQDLGNVIETLTDQELKALAKEIAMIFRKSGTIPTDGKYGVIWGGGDNDVSDTWTERMRLWLDESREHGSKTGVMDESMMTYAENVYAAYKGYFDVVKPVTYYSDISFKNVMIHNGVFNGLVDLDGLTQGDRLEAVGRIKLSWHGTHHGEVYTTALMDEMGLDAQQRKIVTMYALMNAIAWACANGIQSNQNTQSIVDKEKACKDKAVMVALATELCLQKQPGLIGLKCSGV